MYYLTDFHADYPDARVLIASCGRLSRFLVRLNRTAVLVQHRHPHRS